MATNTDKIGKAHVDMVEDELEGEYTGRNVPVSPQAQAKIARFAEATQLTPKIIASAMLDIGASASVESLLERVKIVITNRALRLKN